MASCTPAHGLYQAKDEVKRQGRSTDRDAVSRPRERRTGGSRTQARVRAGANEGAPSRNHPDGEVRGDIVRETTEDTDTNTYYKTMQETRVYLTHLNRSNTQSFILSKLTTQDNSTKSVTMIKEEEKRCQVTVIKDLLSLCKQKHRKDNDD